MKLSILFLFFPVLLLAQHPFEKYPLKGKTALYTTTKFSGEGAKQHAEVYERLKYDSKGRLRNAFRTDGTRQTDELNVYKRNIITSYRCACDNVTAFSKEFAIRDNAELKNLPRYTVKLNPEKFVVITQLDRNGNAVVVSNYSEEGFKTAEVITVYDKANNPVSVEKYDINGNITETISNTYNKAGLLMAQLVKRNREPDFKYNWVYEDTAIKEFLTYRDGVLYDHTVYANVKKDGYNEMGTKDMLLDVATVKQKVYYDDAGREANVINLNPNGSKQSRYEYLYDAKGNLSSYAVYNKDDVLTDKYDYIADDNGNAVEVKTMQLVPTLNTDPKLRKYTTINYKRDIVYARNRAKKK